MDERDADRDQDQRQDETADASDPAEQLLDPAPDRTGEVPVHPQTQQHPTADEPDADELVLTALDRSAQVALRTRAPVP